MARNVKISGGGKLKAALANLSQKVKDGTHVRVGYLEARRMMMRNIRQWPKSRHGMSLALQLLHRVRSCAQLLLSTKTDGVRRSEAP